MSNTNTAETDGTIIEFLLGSHSFEGLWYSGEGKEGAKFWWRKELRKYLEETPSLPSQPTGYKIEIPKDYFPVECNQCGWFGGSNELAGGGQIADTGDYGDAYCPMCGTIHDGGELESDTVSDDYIRGAMAKMVMYATKMQIAYDKIYYEQPTKQPTDNSFEEVKESILNKYERIGYPGKVGGQLAGYNEYDVEKMMQEYAQKTTSLERDSRLAGEAFEAGYQRALYIENETHLEWMNCAPPDKETYISNINKK